MGRFGSLGDTLQGFTLESMEAVHVLVILGMMCLSRLKFLTGPWDNGESRSKLNSFFHRGWSIAYAGRASK